MAERTTIPLPRGVVWPQKRENTPLTVWIRFLILLELLAVSLVESAHTSRSL
jgi:hypothetical protein